MTNLEFAEDGCIPPNIPHEYYAVFLAANCTHTKVSTVRINVRATSGDEARRYVERTRPFPNMHIALVELSR